MSHRRLSILAVLNGEHAPSVPVFSGLSHVLAEGLEHEALAFPETHTDAGKLARAAASTFRLTGLPSAAVPFDLCVEAEALGANVDFGDQGSSAFPRVSEPPFPTSETLLESLRSGIPFGELRDLSRIPIICEAISQLRRDIGQEAVVGGILAGPFTVLSMLVESSGLFIGMKRQPGLVLGSLFYISSFIARVGRAYRQAGADFLTIHEMGGSPRVLGAKRFEQFVLPPLKELAAGLPHPHVLAVCGEIGEADTLLGAAGADALSVDQSNDLASLRLALSDVRLFGNLDPIGLLAGGTQDEIRTAVHKAISDGADAIWPGCDLDLSTPVENIQALLP